MPDGRPSDRHLVAAFERGRERGRHQQKYGRQPPYGEARPYMRDSWLAGYDFGFDEGPADAAQA